MESDSSVRHRTYASRVLNDTQRAQYDTMCVRSNDNNEDNFFTTRAYLRAGRHYVQHNVMRARIRVFSLFFG